MFAQEFPNSYWPILDIFDIPLDWSVKTGHENVLQSKQKLGKILVSRHWHFNILLAEAIQNGGEIFFHWKLISGGMRLFYGNHIVQWKASSKKFLRISEFKEASFSFLLFFGFNFLFFSYELWNIVTLINLICTLRVEILNNWG